MATQHMVTMQHLVLVSLFLAGLNGQTFQTGAGYGWSNTGPSYTISVSFSQTCYFPRAYFVADIIYGKTSYATDYETIYIMWTNLDDDSTYLDSSHTDVLTTVYDAVPNNGGGGWKAYWYDYSILDDYDVSSFFSTNVFYSGISAYVYSASSWWVQDWYGYLYFVCDESTTAAPTNRPTNKPTDRPTNNPTDRPTNNPTKRPSANPSPSPTPAPTGNPSPSPSPSPTPAPTPAPTPSPTRAPTHSPTLMPTDLPTTAKPTKNPIPPGNPTEHPTFRPTAVPTDATNSPTSSPSNMPSDDPTRAPSFNPSTVPTNNPSNNPSSTPTKVPSTMPSGMPSNNPSSEPTNNPSTIPSLMPTNNPSTASPSMMPTEPTSQPSNVPTPPTAKPTRPPSKATPTHAPTITVLQSTKAQEVENDSALTTSNSDDETTSMLIWILLGVILCFLMAGGVFCWKYQKDRTALLLTIESMNKSKGLFYAMNNDDKQESFAHLNVAPRKSMDNRRRSVIPGQEKKQHDDKFKGAVANVMARNSQWARLAPPGASANEVKQAHNRLSVYKPAGGGGPGEGRLSIMGAAQPAAFSLNFNLGAKAQEEDYYAGMVAYTGDMQLLTSSTGENGEGEGATTTYPNMAGKKKNDDFAQVLSDAHMAEALTTDDIFEDMDKDMKKKKRLDSASGADDSQLENAGHENEVNPNDDYNVDDYNVLAGMDTAGGYATGGGGGGEIEEESEDHDNNNKHNNNNSNNKKHHIVVSPPPGQDDDDNGEKDALQLAVELSTHDAKNDGNDNQDLELHSVASQSHTGVVSDDDSVNNNGDNNDDILEEFVTSQ